MRKTILLGTLALMAASLSFSACGGKDDDKGGGSGEGGARALSAEEELFAKLQSEIDDLKQQLEDATGDSIPTLEEALTSAEEQLEECLNLGTCEGFVETSATLSTLTDAICEQVYSCCTDPEAKATFGAGFSDLESCKTSYQAALVAGNSSFVLPGSLPAGFATLDDLASIAEQVQSKRVVVNTDALSACAESLSSAACADETPEAVECGDAVEENPCDKILEGVVESGGRCDASGTLNTEDCAEGLTCRGTGDNGVCVPEVAEGDICQKNLDCQRSADDLYCDVNDATCTLKPIEGEECAFVDPDLEVSEQLSIPCAGDSYCSVKTKTCINTCEKIQEGNICQRFVSNRCDDGLQCDFISEDAYGQYIGRCEQISTFDDDPGDFVGERQQGFGPPSNDCDGVYSKFSRADECGGSCIPAIIYENWYCREEVGEECDSNSQCQSGGCFDDECVVECSDDSECGSDEVCGDGNCYPVRSSGQTCNEDEQCPDAQYCNGNANGNGNGNCVAGVEDGEFCNRARQCESGTYCNRYDNECITEGGRAGGEDCSQWYQCASGRCDTGGECVGDSPDDADAGFLSEGDDCNLNADNSNNIKFDPCKDGLYCERADKLDSGSRDGVCTVQVATGDVCDIAQPNTRQCEGNVKCISNGALGRNVCPVPASPLTDDVRINSCVISGIHVSGPLNESTVLTGGGGSVKELR